MQQRLLELVSETIIAPNLAIVTQGVPFKTWPNNSHVLRHKNEIRSRSIPVQ